MKKKKKKSFQKQALQDPMSQREESIGYPEGFIIEKVSIELDDVIVVALPHKCDFLHDLHEVLLHWHTLNRHNLPGPLMNGFIHNTKGAAGHVVPVMIMRRNDSAMQKERKKERKK